ncbi:MAG: hypothetical protein LBU74_03125 [Methanobacteriaceae archaeon]|nr:hypothetical protein [Candidatus Methanorudis spinitermitis]
MIAPFSAITVNDKLDENIVNVAKQKIGTTILNGTDVIEDSNIQRYPTATNLAYLIDDIGQIDILGLFLSVSTGTVNVPISEITEEGISDSGIATGLNGPGVLVVENGKISVKFPKNFLWGTSVPYTYAVKTENGLSVVENNKTIKSISGDNINNNTVPHEFIPSDDILNWYKKADVGDKLAIEYGLSNFSDGRNSLSPTEVKYFFGEEIYNYLTLYPLNTPILVHMYDYKEKSSESFYSYLGSYPEYNDANRAHNAKQFVNAWNNTIIPPGSTSSGKNIVIFTTSRDPKAPGGGASHGVCPPARALRAAVLNQNFPLPVGMNWDFEAVRYGFNPSSGIKVTNTGDVPVKIVMWTEGEGTSMVICSKIVELVPN